MLSKHINPESLLESSKDHCLTTLLAKDNEIQTAYGHRYATGDIPKFQIPDTGIGASAAYQLIHDELDLDGHPNLNLASFVHTWMEPEADKLMIENVMKNLADSDEYPALMAVHTRCISMLANLWNIPKGQDHQAVGTATTGSSEAIHLGGLAMKRLWQEKRRAQGKDTSKPNIIMGTNAQVALEKFARYFEVEARMVNATEESHHCLDPKKAMEFVDENTIAKTGIDIPIHVDGASGAMFAPFAHPSVKFGFDIPRVKSINTSGHKFGLTYVGLGWILWRGEEYLPKHLIFELHYLGGTEESYTLNFSRPGAQVLLQYFSFLHLGFEGYKAIQRNDLLNARILSRALEATGYYLCVSDIHRKKGTFKFDPNAKAVNDNNPEAYNAGLPVVAFRLTDEFKKEYPHIAQATVSTLLRVKGWIIPNYPLAPTEEKIEILRVVVRGSFSTDLCSRLISDIVETTETLMSSQTLDMSALNFSSNRVEKKEGSMKDHTKGEKNGNHSKHGRAVHRKRGLYRTTC
ncbi:Glutamate decarboxylase [Neolecta irregularis DAH-3]|uniref:glutamate decarboxylase n=1 Tax=Neolecta irregularis (strain DAH-3) TaxID=1198029 RepID=A0A1U7LR20_NEOID|nr:Glutamate decarboxylase [Neolecta irregularis DAH-3]|eukprot:OLL25120.1 Glutamate decarboxylase [Neolecta irregularis DAH-3]